MKVTLTIRNAGSGRVKIATDFKRESQDTPRIANLGLEIKAAMDEMTDRRAKVKVAE